MRDYPLINKDWKKFRRGKRVYKLIGKSRRKRLAWLEIERKKWMNTDAIYDNKIQWIRKKQKKVPLDEIERRKKNKLGLPHSLKDSLEGTVVKDWEMIQTEPFKPEKLTVLEQKQIKRDMIFKWLAESKRKREFGQQESSKEEDLESAYRKRQFDLLARAAEEHEQKRAKRIKAENKFVTKVLKNMGAYICEMRRKAGETTYSRYLRLLSTHKSTLVDDVKVYHTGSKYKGQFSPLGMDGSGVYRLAHGPLYEGFTIDGKFEGFGRMIYPNGGILQGTWSNGVICDPHYVFADGLQFEISDWRYCQMPDRRFQTEILNGLKAPLNVQLANDHPAREIPLNCLDAGEGFYNPRKHYIFHATKGDVIRIPSKKEGAWIKEHCRKAWDENVPFKREMYENWFQGTKFYLEDDETFNKDWYNKMFPDVKVCDADLDEVVLARAGALRQSVVYSSRPHEMDYPSKITEALPFYDANKRSS
ncbi:uncharacterized protein LOC106666223 [Cimex lectularius]|uniref:MORN repeat-containing protein 5 n=1 Tax=Cimex lectularius TaxID=79782 RepID=A0A8I6RLM7_CIMLE|nr:uncharacterized protein LOC106666223 [Cimex lectularius]